MRRGGVGWGEGGAWEGWGRDVVEASVGGCAVEAGE